MFKIYKYFNLFLNLPSLSDISIEWHNKSRNIEIQQSPSQISSIFQGNRVLVYGFIGNCT